MIRLTTAVVEDGFEDDAWAPENFEDPNGTPPRASGLGCSGPSHGNWDYDAPAQVLSVRSERGDVPGSRRIHFEAEYSNGQWARGSFLLRPR